MEGVKNSYNRNSIYRFNNGLKLLHEATRYKMRLIYGLNNPTNKYFDNI